MLFRSEEEGGVEGVVVYGLEEMVRARVSVAVAGLVSSSFVW
mgnify:CR=1 FL=1